MHTGARLTDAPDQNPYSTVRARVIAWLPCAVYQRQNTEAIHIMDIIHIVLMTPKRSATYPGKARPGIAPRLSSPRACVAYLRSFRALISIDEPAHLFDGSRLRTSRQARSPCSAHRRAMTLIAQPKPIPGARYSMTRGNQTPPTPPAVQAMHAASPRLLRNQCPMTVTQGL